MIPISWIHKMNFYSNPFCFCSPLPPPCRFCVFHVKTRRNKEKKQKYCEKGFLVKFGVENGSSGVKNNQVCYFITPIMFFGEFFISCAFNHLCYRKLSNSFFSLKNKTKTRKFFFLAWSRKNLWKFCRDGDSWVQLLSRTCHISTLSTVCASQGLSFPFKLQPLRLKSQVGWTLSVPVHFWTNNTACKYWTPTPKKS